MCLVGAGIIVKVAFGFINLAYSYFPTQAPYVPYPVGTVAPLIANSYVEQQRGQDLVLGITLFVIGALVAAAHYYLARAVAHMTGGSPAWITRGTLLALTVVTAVAGIWSTVVGLNAMLSYFIIGSPQSQQPWGDSVGLAIAFVPAWLYAMTKLVGDLRRPRMEAAPAPSA